MPGPRATPYLDVVIADDDDDIRLLLKLQLRQFGIDVVGEASNGHAAIELCERVRPDAVILDLAMPELSGFDAIPEIQKRTPQVKIIAYSAVTGEYARAELGRLGIPLQLKNGDPEPLVATIRASVSGRFLA